MIQTQYVLIAVRDGVTSEMAYEDEYEEVARALPVGAAQHLDSRGWNVTLDRVRTHSTTTTVLDWRPGTDANGNRLPEAGAPCNSDL